MKKNHILVIDDEGGVRKTVCDNLRLAGYEVFSASDGAEGLDMIDPANPPCVIITDIIMPNKNGFDVIKAVQRDYPTVRLIAMSGGGRVDEANDLLKKAGEMGADVVMPKPLDLDALEETIDVMLRSCNA